MQYEVKNLIADLPGWSGLSGPIPSIQELRKKKEESKKVPHLDSTDRAEVSRRRPTGPDVTA